jgi:hypothetical protein
VVVVKWLNFKQTGRKLHRKNISVLHLQYHLCSINGSDRKESKAWTHNGRTEEVESERSEMEKNVITELGEMKHFNIIEITVNRMYGEND